MKSTLKISFLAVLCSLTLFVAPAFCGQLSLADLYQGGTITVLDKVFSNFREIDSQIVGDAVANPNMVFITPLADDPLNPGLKFTIPVGEFGTEFFNAGNSSVMYRFGFDVTTVDGRALIKDNSLLINGWVFDATQDASIRIMETLTDAAGEPLGTKSVIAVPGDQPDSGNVNHFDSRDFDPVSFLSVEKFIDIRGPNQADGAFLTMFEQRFSQVPEPASFVLVMLGLVGAAGLRRLK